MSSENPILPYQKQFIDFLVEAEVLTFGDFVTKSGRKTPYFVNTGRFNTGARIARVGDFFATHIQKMGLSEIDSVFGPSYKGVPLCVTTSRALHQEHGIDVGFTFNRKERKEHGDGGNYVGTPLNDGTRILIVEDVITAGLTLREVVTAIKDFAAVDIRGVIVSVDRCEKGKGESSATKEVSDALGLAIYPIVTIHEVIQYLSEPNSSGFTLSEDLLTRMNAYLEEYGA